MKTQVNVSRVTLLVYTDLSEKEGGLVDIYQSSRNVRTLCAQDVPPPHEFTRLRGAFTRGRVLVAAKGQEEMKRARGLARDYKDAHQTRLFHVL